MVDSFKAFLILEFLPDRRGLALERVTAKDRRTPEAATSRCMDRDAPLPVCPEEVEMVLESVDVERGPSQHGSSFAFDHPGAGPRRLSFKRNPSAGDTSLMDAAPAPAAQESVEAGAPASSVRRPSGSRFAQQTLPHKQTMVTGPVILRAAAATGIALIVLGAGVLGASNQVAQFAIQYDGEFRRSLDTSASEMFHRPCPVIPGGVNSCLMDVQIPTDLEPPIIVTYEISPFYQNYYSYQTSVGFDQLAGKWTSPEVVATSCPHKATRVTASGDDIFPCGLIATSVFNDTIEFLQAPIDEEDERMAWRSDYDRFANPPDYLQRPNTSWLYERYPMITDRAKGVRSRRFVDWMFPSFFGHVRNMYGFVKQPLRKGGRLTVRVNASFPVQALGAEKRIVVSTRNGLGGRHSKLAYVLLASGVACLAMAFSVCLIQRTCPRDLGRTRFPGPPKARGASREDRQALPEAREPLAPQGAPAPELALSPGLLSL